MPRITKERYTCEACNKSLFVHNKAMHEVSTKHKLAMLPPDEYAALQERIKNENKAKREERMREVRAIKITEELDADQLLKELVSCKISAPPGILF